jgi:Gelsolin repeat
VLTHSNLLRTHPFFSSPLLLSSPSLPCTPFYFPTLLYTALHCPTLPYSALPYSALSCPALSEDVFLLDTYTQVFLWVGEGSTEEEKGKGLIFAKKFIKEVQTYIHTYIPYYLSFSLFMYRSHHLLLHDY